MVASRVVAGVEGLLIAAAALLGATGFGLWRRRADGRFRPVGNDKRASVSDAGVPEQDAVPADEPRTSAMTITPVELGQDLGRLATFVSFSTAFCQPCRANRQALSHLATTTDGVTHVEIDAESRLDLVRSLGVTRTPTTFVLDGSGVVRQRATGALRLADARAVVQELTNV